MYDYIGSSAICRSSDDLKKKFAATFHDQLTTGKLKPMDAIGSLQAF
jgi:hypothetical protein